MYITNILKQYTKNIVKNAINVNDKVSARTYLASVTPEHPVTICFNHCHLTTRIVAINGLPTSYECFAGTDEKALEVSDTFEEMMQKVDTILNTISNLNYAYDTNEI